MTGKTNASLGDWCIAAATAVVFSAVGVLLLYLVLPYLISPEVFIP